MKFSMRTYEKNKFCLVILIVFIEDLSVLFNESSSGESPQNSLCLISNDCIPLLNL